MPFTAKRTDVAAPKRRTATQTSPSSGASPVAQAAEGIPPALNWPARGPRVRDARST
ncbi:MAG: EspF repeat-containing protein [Solirubrobacteraceae bacterium]